MIAPPARGSFEWRVVAGRQALVCRPLESIASHFFTTRDWSLGSPGASANDVDGWREVALGIGAGAAQLARARQVHGTTVFIAGPTAGPLPDADIIVTTTSDVAAAVQVADCIPLLLGDRETRACVAAHAGWRGLAASVPEAAVAALVTKFGSRPERLVAAVGPSIGACCYEIGTEVREQFAANGHDERWLDRWFTTNVKASSVNASLVGLPSSARAGHWYLDMWLAVRDQLERAGVAPPNIHVAELCTASHPEVFCSYRRDGTGAGRLAAVVRPLPPGP
jgi:YfiH family protein